MVDAGYFTYPACWNQGYTTEALRRLLAFAFGFRHPFAGPLRLEQPVLHPGFQLPAVLRPVRLFQLLDKAAFLHDPLGAADGVPL